MIKKAVSLIVIAILLISTVTYAAAPTYKIELATNNLKVNQDSEIEVTLKLKDFTGMNEGIFGFLAQIEYDKELFEVIKQDSFTAKGGWSAPTFNEVNGQLVAERSSGVKENSEVFSVKLKVKKNALIGAETTIKIKNFTASEGETDIKATEDAQIKINIVEKTDNKPGDNTNNIPGNNTNNIINTNTTNNITTITNTNTNNTAKNENIASKPLPQTGDSEIIIISIIAIVIIGMFSYIKYKKTY